LTKPESSLQFEHAEFGGEAPGPTSCERCQAAITGFYHLVNGAVTCDACREQLVNAPVEGTRVGRLSRALLLGIAGGAVGAGLWYAVRALTGYEVGLISIVVGLLVGNGVRKGSGGRGGRRYQVIAVAITYLAIVSTYVPMIVKQIFDGTEAAGAPAAGAPVAGDPGSATPAGGKAPAPAGSAPAVPEPTPTAGQALLALGLFALLVTLIALAAPFLGGLENILGIFIIAFGLWEAWKLNRVAPLVVTGPHALATRGEHVA
jgi:hypothetical protein